MHQRKIHLVIITQIICLVLGHRTADPTYLGTAEQYARAERRIKAFISYTSGDPDKRKNGEALFRFHGPNKKVFGTVMIFHGGFGTPATMKTTVDYLFQNGFNIYAPPLAGHAYQGNRWPYTLLREQFGGKAARRILLADLEIRAITEKINNGTLQPPVHRANGFDFDAIKKKALWLLKKGLSKKDHDHVMKAFQLLVREDYYPGLEKDLYKYFESDHFLYDSDPYYRLADIAALPGPVFTIGFSMGGVQALNLAARAKYIEKMVLLAPFIETAAPKKKPDLRYLLEAVGVLDLYSAPAPEGTSISSRVLPPADIAGRLTTQDDITRNIRENTDTFCVIAEDDGVADVDMALSVCRDRLANPRSYAFVYPAKLKLGHSISPGPRSKLSIPLLQEIYRFFTTGSVRKSNLLKPKGDPKLP